MGVFYLGVLISSVEIVVWFVRNIFIWLGVQCFINEVELEMELQIGINKDDSLWEIWDMVRPSTPF